MKCTYLVLASLLAILLISSCSVEQQVIPQTTIPPSQTTVPDPTIPPEPEEKFDFEISLTVNGMERSYLLHLPPDIEVAVPVIFVFHGGTVTPKDMRLITQFDTIADKNNFAVVYPAGVEFTWNTGWEIDSGHNFALANNIDDLGFVKQILIDLESYIQIDPNQIYAAGHSQGGMLVYRLACEMSDTFAAIASVSGPHLVSECDPTQTVSVIHIHGMKDTTVKYLGGGRAEYPPAEETIELWAALNNCSDSKNTRDDENGITQIMHSPCQSESSVLLITTDKGNHSWLKVGLSASEVIWDFFSSHPRP